MTTKKIAVEFDADVITARALARAVFSMLEAVRASEGSIAVDGFSMNKTDGWTGDYRITVKRQL